MAHPHTLRRVLLVGAALALLQALAVAAYVLVEHARDPGSNAFRYETAGLQARSIPVVDLIGPRGVVTSTRALRGHPVLLHFWSTTCPPCRDELPDVLRLSRTVPGLRVVAVATDDSWLAVSRFFHGHIPRDVVRDPSRVLIESFSVTSLPDTWLFDPAGTPRARVRGARDWRSARATDFLSSHTRDLRTPHGVSDPRSQ